MYYNIYLHPLVYLCPAMPFTPASTPAPLPPTGVRSDGTEVHIWGSTRQGSEMGDDCERNIASSFPILSLPAQDRYHLLSEYPRVSHIPAGDSGGGGDGGYYQL